MALRFIDGFGGGDSTVLKWDVTSAGYFINNGGSPRVAGGYYGLVSSSVLYKTIPAANLAIIGTGMNAGSGTVTYTSFYGDSGATQHITVLRNASTGLIEVRRGSTAGTLLATGSTTTGTNAWFYIEVSVTISATVGEVHVRLNGQSTDEVAFTGNTKNGGTNTTVDKVSIGNSGINGGYFADFYVLDNTGSANNTFLGDVTVRTLSPSGNGTYSQLTNSAGNSTNNYSYVNEHGYSGANYTGSVTTGLRDTYAIADLPSGVSSIYGLQVTGYMAKSDASAASAKLVLRSGGSLYYDTPRALTTSYQSYYALYESDPATSIPWSISGVNGLETGMEVA
ncbi:MAG TPA: hypothetical protein VLG92_03415 [Candidatus Saccharimonadia bacterium]|nr:hypothetical protein [Candidatus Saccharimonadia bacterium]